MDDNTDTLVSKEPLVLMNPEGGIDPSAINFSARPQQEKFLGGGKDQVSKNEFNFGEIRRPFTVDDVKDFQNQFRSFNVWNNENRGGESRIGENQFYQYLSTGTFYGVEKKNEKPETLTDQGKQAYEDLLHFTYKNWRENLIRKKDEIAKVRPEVIRQFGDLTQLPNPRSASEIRDLYAANPKLNDFSAASYQDGIVKGVVNTPFLHFKGHRYSGYEYDQPKTEMRLYLNPPINEMPRLANEFVRIASERRIPYYFKLFDYSLQQPFPEDLKRTDRMLFYTDRANAGKIASVLEEIKGEHPDWFVDRSLPPMTAKIMDGVGIAEEPNETQHQKYSSRGEGRTSFNSVRAKFLDRLWPGIVKKVMLQQPDLKPRGGRDLRQIFNDFVPSEDKQYVDILWRTNMNPPTDDKNSRRVMDDALKRLMVDVVPSFSPEDLLPWLNRGAEILGPEFGIDPKNLAFNKAA